ncbi:MAG: hypothetical protein AUJ04_07610 [Acidobacteria bacterium 13_1_40CM_3_55_6]|nr:MAG: hypothetical protein AUJ04_07610 [Acidobacteria bacterium 13_1_40CM_3_55_6]
MIRFVLSLTLCQCTIMAQEMVVKPIRVPLEKPVITLKSPSKYEKRIIGQNPMTGEMLYYDPRPRVILIDARTKKYGLRWVGHDGKEKTVIYQRPDGVDIVVSVSVSRVTGGQFLYLYSIANLRSSAEYLSTIALQNYSSNVTPIKNPGLYVGGVTRNAREFKDGNWIGFSILSHDVTPGQNVEVKLLSGSPPGLVECRAAGVLGMKGVGEEMPQELENVLPGYEAWPHGYTIGPIDRLQSLSHAERANYLANLFPQFRKLGWISPVVSRWYEQNLKQENLSQVLRQSEQDVKSGKMTSEVYGMIQAINY